MEREENTTALVEETVDTQETTQETAETSAEVTFDQNAFRTFKNLMIQKLLKKLHLKILTKYKMI
jgi:hypothetical protein